MILWTVMPLELVLGEESFTNTYEEIDYEGIKVLVERTAATECRIVRLLSTDPSHFLRPELQPGCTLSYKPVWN